MGNSGELADLTQHTHSVPWLGINIERARLVGQWLGRFFRLHIALMNEPVMIYSMRKSLSRFA